MEVASGGVMPRCWPCRSKRGVDLKASEKQAPVMHCMVDHS